MRLRSDFWIGALRRRAEAAGAYVAVARRGSPEAGAIFLVVDRLDGSADLYAPAPQTEIGAEAEDRLFTRIMDAAERGRIGERLEREQRFDSDLWVVEIEDRQGRCFAEIAEERPKTDPFSFR